MTPSGWHDAAMDVPVVDLDYLLIDSNDATPLALVDYKHWRALFCQTEP